jgi:hypothetical protein
MDFTRIVSVEDSGQITRILYDPVSEKMSVRFKNKTNYIYEGISASVFGDLVSAPSVGVYFSSYIRNRYIGQKLG